MLKHKLTQWALGHVVLPMAQASGLEGRLRAVLEKNRRREMLTRRALIVAALAAGGVVAPLAMMRLVAKAAVSSAAHHHIQNIHIYHLAPPDSPATAIAKLKRLYPLIEIYRQRHGGDFPATRPNGLEVDMSNHPRAYGLPDQGAGNIWQAAQFFGNCMTTDTGDPATDTGDPAYDISYFMNGKRPNGVPVGSPKLAGTRDVYAYTDQRAGFYLVLWDNGQVEKVPASEALSVPMYDPIAYGTSAAGTDNRQIAFRGQAGLPSRVLIRPLVSSRAPARSKYVAYNFTWGKIPGNPDKAVAQLKQIYQWGQVYRARHGGAYPASSADFDADLWENPQVYGLSDSPDGRGALQALKNPDVRFAERTSHDPSLIPYVMFAPRFDGQPLGGPKPPGTRDVLATTDMYEHTNWNHGIPSGHVGFWLVLWDDGTVERVPGGRILYVPRGGLTGKTVTPAAVREAMTHGGVEVTFGFPGQAGLPANTLTRDQTQAAGLGSPDF